MKGRSRRVWLWIVHDRMPGTRSDYCMKFDKYADKCNADEKCYFYQAKDGDKGDDKDKKPGYGDDKDQKPDGGDKGDGKGDRGDKDKTDEKYGEYKRGTGCYPKKYSKKDRRLGGHGDHGEGDHGKDANGKDVTTKDGHDDGWWTSIRVSFIVQILCLLAMICANMLPHCMLSIWDVVR